MKIFFCLKTFLPAQVAGTEIYVAALAKGLMQNGHEVAVVKPNYDSVEFTGYHYEGIKVLEYPEEALVTKDLITGKSFPKGVAAFKALLIKEQPGLIHFHEISGSNGITLQHYREAQQLNIDVFTTLHLVRYVCKTSTLMYKNKYSCDGVIDIKKCAACLLSERGLPSVAADVLSFAGTVLFKNKIRLNNNAAKLYSLLNYPAYIQQHKNNLAEIFKISRKVFVLNNWFKDILLSNGMPSQKIAMIPQALPTASASDGDYSTPLNDVSPFVKLVFMGRISEIKGLYFLLDVLKNCVQKNWQLGIYGKPTEKEYYEKCMLLTKDMPTVNWRGVAAPAEVVATLCKYDLLMFPSSVQEMAPFITLEAFAAGIPVLAADVYANRESIQEGINGWLYTLNDPQSLQHKLEMILQNPALIDAAKKQLPAVLPFETVVKKHEAIYQQAVLI